MDPTEKVIVRLPQDTVIVLQALVDRGEYDSLSESVSDAIRKMIESKFTPKEISKIVNEHAREKPINMESLLTDGEQVSTDDAIRKAVRDYIKSMMEPEE
ncbi:MAG: hypothetical protein FWH45_02435 [Methanomassiliicoccaceae archaeon]|nr:hypothetical protein [Methanomassiliicoccaceae archaeon]MCL2146018.1 hypothetical protein [Methanomassiliicoccaceae archaeon]